MTDKRLAFSGGFSITLAFLLLILPFRWVLAFSIAALVHEAGHYLAILLVCGKNSDISFYAWGARMALPEMTRGKEALCALAGPLFGLSLLLFARWMPRVALCAAMQSVYNLLPIYPLDGGRALQSTLAMTLPPPKAEKLCAAITVLCSGAIALLAVYAAIFLKLGIFPLILGVVFLIKRK